jgi:hypothetical protein
MCIWIQEKLEGLYALEYKISPEFGTYHWYSKVDKLGINMRGLTNKKYLEMTRMQ